MWEEDNCVQKHEEKKQRFLSVREVRREISERLLLTLTSVA